VTTVIAKVFTLRGAVLFFIVGDPSIFRNFGLDKNPAQVIV
jgi:hypothetical protein